MSIDAGLYDGIPHDIYHADPCEQPSLSAHTAMVLVKRSAGHAARLHPRLGGVFKKRTDAIETGSLLHDFILGGGSDFVEVEYEDWRTKDAKAKRDEAHAAGKIAVLAEKLAILRAAAEETKKVLPFDIAKSRREVTGIWTAEETPCRCRIDTLFPDWWVWDLKFTEDAVTAAADRNIAGHGYPIQAAANIEAIETLIPESAGRVHFGLCFVEWENPAIGIMRREIRGELLELGQRQWKRAQTIWGQCLSANHWPGYSAKVVEAQCPPWIAAEDMERQLAEMDGIGTEPF